VDGFEQSVEAFLHDAQAIQEVDIDGADSRTVGEGGVGQHRARQDGTSLIPSRPKRLTIPCARERWR
jgi:hypothetical protein